MRTEIKVKFTFLKKKHDIITSTELSFDRVLKLTETVSRFDSGMTPTFRVALDLGVTHVGFAFGLISDTSVQCFYDWDGAVNSYCKTSSCVLYQGCNAIAFG